MSTELPGVGLTPEDRDAIERIVDAEGRPDSAYVAIARHFVAEGMERAAAVCDERGTADMGPWDLCTSPAWDEADRCAAAIRAAKDKKP